MKKWPFPQQLIRRQTITGGGSVAGGKAKQREFAGRVQGPAGAVRETGPLTAATAIEACDASLHSFTAYRLAGFLGIDLTAAARDAVVEVVVAPAAV